MNNLLKNYIPWILIILFIILQIIIFLLIYYCFKFWKDYLIKIFYKSREINKNESDKKSLYTVENISLIENLNIFNLSYTNVIPEIHLDNPGNSNNNCNNLNYAGSVDFYVRFGLIEKTVTITLLKINMMPYSDRGIFGKLKIITLSLPHLEYFEIIYEKYPITHTWPVNFDLSSINSTTQEFIFIFSFKILISKNESKYIGTTIINLKSFYSNYTYIDGPITTQINTLPPDYFFIKNNFLVISYILNIPTPYLYLTLKYNSIFGRLEIGITYIYLPNLKQINAKEITCIISIFDTTLKLIDTAKISKLQKSENIEDIDLKLQGIVSFIIPYHKLAEYTLVIKLAFKKNSHFKITNFDSISNDNKKIGYVSLGKYFSDFSSTDHWNQIILQPDLIVSKWHKLIY